MHVERLFQIVFLLMSGSCGTAKELAEHCSVSVRTIQRDLDALSLAGIPVFSSRGYGGGIGLLKEFTLDKTFMTEQEQADILHGLQALEGAGYPDGNAALHKLAALFRRKEDRWLRVDFSSWCGSGFGKEKFHRLKEAILAKKVVRFTYFSSENRVSERFAEPLCLLFRERAWYVCVFDRKKTGKWCCGPHGSAICTSWKKRSSAPCRKTRWRRRTIQKAIPCKGLCSA